MYSITKRIEIAGAHKLDVPYDSPCKRLHGHNWIIEIEISSEYLNKEGMVIDFSILKKWMEKEIKEYYDHRNINEQMNENQNPTAENLAAAIYIRLNSYPELHTNIFISKVTVQESEGNKACYTP